ncbi:hypothetical protein PENTCL1PPCAC_4932, partial [Pristionchus entomophagus]
LGWTRHLLFVLLLRLGRTRHMQLLLLFHLSRSRLALLFMDKSRTLNNLHFLLDFLLLLSLQQNYGLDEANHLAEGIVEGGLSSGCLSCTIGGSTLRMRSYDAGRSIWAL